MLRFSRPKAGLGMFVDGLIHNRVTRTLLVSSAIGGALAGSRQDGNTRFISIASWALQARFFAEMGFIKAPTLSQRFLQTKPAGND